MSECQPGRRMARRGHYGLDQALHRLGWLTRIRRQHDAPVVPMCLLRIGGLQHGAWAGRSGRKKRARSRARTWSSMPSSLVSRSRRRRRWPKCRSVVLLRGHAPVREPSIGAAVVGKGAPLWVSVRSDPDCHGIRYVQRWLQSRFRTARQCRRSAIRSLCAICSRSASRGARQNTVLGWVGRRRWPSPRCRRPVRRRHGPRLHEIRGA
jgi:hypothetical protein